MTKLEISPRHFRLFRKEYVSLFPFGHDIGVPLDFLMTLNAFAVKYLNHADEIIREVLEADYCIA